MTEQRTDDWFAQRLAKVTASRISDVVAKTKTGYSTSRENYMADLIVERLTGQRASSYTNAAMEWGTATEPAARAAYSARSGELVEEVGFIDHPHIPMSGASPDGVVGDGLLEIKCPFQTAVHLDTILSGDVPAKHLPQLAWQMACTGAKWVDFVSFDPRCPEGLRLFVQRVKRDEQYINLLETEVRKFLLEMETKLAALQEKACG